MRRHFRTWVVAVVAVFVALFFAQGAQAQYLENLKIGDPIKLAIAAFGTPGNVGAYKEYKQARWKLGNGNDYSATATQDDDLTMVYMELDWGGKPEGGETGVFDFVFGQTTLDDVRKKLGSNGMAFRQRPAVTKVETGLLMLNSYEIDTTVVTFYNVVPPEDFDAARVKPEALGDYAKLVAVSFASVEYAASDWGERIYDPNYKKPEAP